MTLLTLNSATKILPRKLERAALSGLPILLRGPTGSGKEYIAARLHKASGRPGPMIPINMAGLKSGTSQSELFGSVRGAYTGADRDRVGLFEAADKGTIFLDEIGDAPHFIQVEILRILETRQVRRLGANVSKPLDFRIIAATHQPLERLIEQGSFRADLYYRLQGVEVCLNPLKDCREDILPLADSFLRHISPEKTLSLDAQAALLAHSWPGNIRELKQAIIRAAALSETDEIHDTHFRFSGSKSRAAPNVGYKTQLVAHTYAKTGKCIAATADTLGLHRSTVHRHLTPLQTARALTL